MRGTRIGQDTNGDDRLLLSSKVIVDVLSESTAERDVGLKAEGYKSIPSLEE